EGKAVSMPPRPLWVRLQRIGEVFKGFQSSDGVAWTQISTNQVIAFGPELLVGLGVSAQAEGRLATATVDNVSIVGSTLSPLLGRTVGFSSIQGTDVEDAGLY